jgi:hypothetical protein
VLESTISKEIKMAENLSSLDQDLTGKDNDRDTEKFFSQGIKVAADSKLLIE